LEEKWRISKCGAGRVCNTVLSVHQREQATEIERFMAGALLPLLFLITQLLPALAMSRSGGNFQTGPGGFHFLTLEVDFLTLAALSLDFEDARHSKFKAD